MSADRKPKPPGDTPWHTKSMHKLPQLREQLFWLEHLIAHPERKVPDHRLVFERIRGLESSIAGLCGYLKFGTFPPHRPRGRGR